MKRKLTRSTHLMPTFGLVLLLLGLTFKPIQNVALFAHAFGQSVIPQAVNAGPDLTVEISLDPVAPNENETATATFVVRNIGDAASGAFAFYAYKDPVDQPPNTGTAGGFLFSVPGLNAGGSVSFSRQYTFSGVGCNHVVYGWADRANTVVEGDETNNLIGLPVCIGVTPTPPPTCTIDPFEDDYVNGASCGFAGWIGEDAPQAHSFCTQDHQTSDVDLVKFTVFNGLTYTLSSSAVGANASPKITFFNTCNGAPLSTGNGSASIKANANGVYYAKIENNTPASGPQTSYSLVLNSTNEVSDAYEPDNLCSTARDIAADGTHQDHRFQRQGDEDWVKFAIKAGESYAVIADQPGPNVTLLVQIFSACNQVLSNTTVAAGAFQASSAANTDQIYYARLTNQGNGFGASATYRLAVTASNCVNDDQEEDDTKDQAKTLPPDGTKTQHNFCPAQDQDWVKFNLQAGKIYVLQTSDLAFASDTVLTLFGPDGTTQLAENDDYNYVSGSRIVFTPPAAGVYYARVRHANPIANGPNTNYSVSIQEGLCNPDQQEGANGNNGPGDAALLPTTGISLTNNFCADPLNTNLGDQDWLTFNGVAGGHYEVLTTALGPNSDTVLELYADDGNTRLLRNDDAGQGRGATLNFTPTVSSPYFVRVLQYNSSVNGNDASYSLQAFATEPPTPTPTPTLAPTPTPTPPPTATPPPSTARTLILVNRQRFETLYGAPQASALMDKLFALANDGAVQGAVLQVETDPNVAAAYTAWLNDASNNDKANAVIAAIRNRLMAFLDNAPQVKQVVIVGNDQIIPFRRVLDQVQPAGQATPGALASIEQNYASNLADNGSVKAALAANMILTDDYLVDKAPSQWQDKQKNQYELYLPDYASSRLVEDPTEISAFIDNFLGGAKSLTTTNVLVTGYDFVQDSAGLINTLFNNDKLPGETINANLIGPNWAGNDLRTLYLQAAPRFDLYSINGHSTHVAQGVPDKQDLTASEVAAAPANLSGALIFSMGCHAGLNDPGVLDLPEAYLKKLANYVGNTGFGWGGGGVVYSEALFRNYTRELLRDTKANIGPALVAAKQKYYSTASTFNAYDAKVLMQVTLYGLPMVEVNSGGTLNDADPFPSADDNFTPPSSFGDGPATGSVGYHLPSAFGAFGEATAQQGQSFNLDGNVTYSSGEPVQPEYFRNVAAPATGELRGVVFMGGTYSDTVQPFDPVIALADNEYVTDKTEPTFASDNFYPAVPFTVRSGDGIPPSLDAVVMSLGQFKNNAGVNGAAAQQTGTARLFDQMAFSAYYSQSPDHNAANISFIDGVLDASAPSGHSVGQIKVETSDPSGIHTVVIAYNQAQGQWQSKTLTFDAATQKWTGVISGTTSTQFFVQVVDNAGNVAVNDNKGRYYRLATPLPLATGRPLASQRRVYLPVINR